MKAIIVESSGGPEVLQLSVVETPAIQRPSQILVKLKAAGVNPIDYKIRQNLDRFPVTLPAILGCDGAGVVEAVGSDVTQFQPGNEVYFYQVGFNGRQGTYAEYALVDEALVAHKPKSLTFEEAAAVPLVMITAWESLYDRVQVRDGMQVLIEAGAGGVGHIAIQLAKIAGARVATTVSTAEKEKFVIDLGATYPIRYRDEDVVQKIKDWTRDAGVDIAFDTVGDKVFSQCCECTKVYGDVVTILEPPPEMDWMPSRMRNLKISLEMMLTPVLMEMPEWMKHQGHILKSAAELIDQGKIKIKVSRTFALEEAGEAHRYLETQSPMGKVVLVIE